MDDSYCKEFEAEVTSAKDKFVVLSTTAFYPNSGGQPYDIGKLIDENGNEYEVVYVGKFAGNISHEVNKTGLKQGDKVKGVIDWQRRYKLMRSHTASHVLSAVMHDNYGAKITGNQLSLEKIRVDFNLESFDRELINKAIEQTNEYLKEDLPVSISYLPRKEALNDPSLVKLAGTMPPEINELRIVSVGTVDRQADGGTHVKSTREVGQLTVLKMDNKGKSNRRLYAALKDD